MISIGMKGNESMSFSAAQAVFEVKRKTVQPAHSSTVRDKTNQHICLWNSINLIYVGVKKFRLQE